MNGDRFVQRDLGDEVERIRIGVLEDPEAEAVVLPVDAVGDRVATGFRDHRRVVGKGVGAIPADRRGPAIEALEERQVPVLQPHRHDLVDLEALVLGEAAGVIGIEAVRLGGGGHHLRRHGTRGVVALGDRVCDGLRGRA